MSISVIELDRPWRRLALVAGAQVAAIVALGALVLVTMIYVVPVHTLLAFWTTLIVGIAVLVVGDGLIALIATARVGGYREATPEELAKIQARGLWHFTDAIGEVFTAEAGTQRGTVTLSPTACRWYSKMRHRSHPLARRVPASYAFTVPPTRSLTAVHVPKARRRVLLQLDGSRITNVYVGPGNAIALPDGYTGPGQIITWQPGRSSD